MKIKGVNLHFELVKLTPTMPNGFTGRWRDNHYYYLGQRWYGPSNMVGAKRVLGRNIMLTAPEHR